MQLIEDGVGSIVHIHLQLELINDVNWRDKYAFEDAVESIINSN